MSRLSAAVDHAEHAGETFWSEMTAVLTDPAHLFAELVFVLVIDVLLLGLLVPVVRRRWRQREERLHRLLDAEHGFSHEPEGSLEGSAAAPSPEVLALAEALVRLGVGPSELERALRDRDPSVG